MVRRRGSRKKSLGFDPNSCMQGGEEIVPVINVGDIVFEPCSFITIIEIAIQ